MKKIRVKIILFVLFLLLFCICIFFVLNSSSEFKGYEKKRIRINDKVFTVYISDIDEKRTKGLSGVKKLKPNEGMMFVWDMPDYRYFWMKDMNFSLDFVFIRNSKVVDMLENISPETYPKSFTSSEKSDRVIEFSSGTVKYNNIRKGYQVN